MIKLMKKIIFIVAILAVACPSMPKAGAALANREEVLTFAQSAFEAQVSISEKPRTIDEIDKILSPYFSGAAKELFYEENLFIENGLFITYGTDFPIYYIPFFTYSEETKVVWMDQKIYLFEFFPKSEEGPVSYESHYEGVLLTNDEGEWKIAEFLYDNIPQEVIHKGEKEQDSPPLDRKKAHEYQEMIIHSSYQVGLCMNPIQFSLTMALTQMKNI